MKKQMKHNQSVFLLLFGMSLFAGCNNLVGPGNHPIWTQEELQSLEIRGVCATGDVIIAAAYRPNTSYAYLFRSADNGATWAMVDSFGVDNHSPGLSLWIYPSFAFLVYGADIFAGIGGGINRGNIYLSTDNGITWNDKGIDWPETGENQSENINSFCAVGQDIFAGTFHGIFLSTDHAATWKAANTEPVSPVEGVSSVGGDLFACTEGNGIFASADDGSTWVRTDTVNYIFVSLTAIGDDIFAGAFQFYEKPSTGGVFRSTNNGATWFHSDSGLTNHELNTLIVSGANLYAGTNSGTFVSTNLGASWTFNSNNSASDSMAVLALAVSSSSLIEGTLHGVWVYPLSQLAGVKSETNRNQQQRKGG